MKNAKFLFFFFLIATTSLSMAATEVHGPEIIDSTLAPSGSDCGGFVSPIVERKEPIISPGDESAAHIISEHLIFLTRKEFTRRKSILAALAEANNDIALVIQNTLSQENDLSTRIVFEQRAYADLNNGEYYADAVFDFSTDVKSTLSLIRQTLTTVDSMAHVGERVAAKLAASQNITLSQLLPQLASDNSIDIEKAIVYLGADETARIYTSLFKGHILLTEDYNKVVLLHLVSLAQKALLTASGSAATSDRVKDLILNDLQLMANLKADYQLQQSGKPSGYVKDLEAAKQVLQRLPADQRRALAEAIAYDLWSAETAHPGAAGAHRMNIKLVLHRIYNETHRRAARNQLQHASVLGDSTDMIFDKSFMRLLAFVVEASIEDVLTHESKWSEAVVEPEALISTWNRASLVGAVFMAVGEFLMPSANVEQTLATIVAGACGAGAVAVIQRIWPNIQSAFARYRLRLTFNRNICAAVNEIENSESSPAQDIYLEVKSE